ncbi:MlaD family protein [Bizionia argentinensis]|uniref:MlaD family protein n=1 Tax=Bizionia argentinensis TaxID=456455 RepID=UPI0002232509|nr:MlaD family protein [Bizionia argentinensis]
MKISKEVKTAILVLAGIVFLVFGINYLKGVSLFDGANTYYTEFDYNALVASSAVTIKGNNIGQIKSIKYIPETSKTLVAFTVKNELEFSKNSKVRLYSSGLLGDNALAIIPANDGAMAVDGDKLVSEVEMGLVEKLTGNFSEISTDLGSTLKSADTTLIGLNSILRDESDQGLKSAIAELNATIKSFRGLSDSFNTLVRSNEAGLSNVIRNFDSISGNLAVVTNDLKKADLSKTLGNLDNTLANVNSLLADLENGQGTMGKLLKDDKLYTNLEIASMQLRELLQDVKLNPKRYVNVSVFGGKNKKDFEKPEDERE